MPRSPQALGELFVECIAAPGFSAEALAILAKAKTCAWSRCPIPGSSRCRAALDQPGPAAPVRRFWRPGETQWKVVSERQPTEASCGRCASPGKPASMSNPMPSSLPRERPRWASAAGSPTGWTACASPSSAPVRNPAARSWPPTPSSPSPTRSKWPPGRHHRCHRPRRLDA